jgi:excisionase family DNA binding protein
VADVEVLATSEPLLIDIAASAERAGLPVRLIREARARRELPAVRIGKKIWFRPTDVDAWVERLFRDATPTVPSSRPVRSPARDRRQNGSPSRHPGVA